MASRMEKYYNNSNALSRTNRNASLYDELYNGVEYSNVEGIADIDKSNSVDIRKLKQLLSEQADDRQFKFVRKTITTDSKDDTIYEEKNYDLKDVLTDAKKNRPKDEKEKYVKQIKSDIIANKLKEMSSSNDAVEELVNPSVLKSLNDNELSLDLLDSLKAADNNLVEESSNSRGNCNTEELDKSFFTSSMSFSKEDFEELDDINENLKKKNIGITILIIFLIIVIIAGALFLYYNLF